MAGTSSAGTPRKITRRGVANGLLTFAAVVAIILAIVRGFFGVSPLEIPGAINNGVNTVLGKPSTDQQDLAKSVTAQAAATDIGKGLVAQNYVKEEFLTDRGLVKWLRDRIAADGYTPSAAEYVAFYKQGPGGKLPPRYDNSPIPPGVVLDVNDTGFPVALIQEYGEGRGMACYAGQDSSRVDLAIAWPDLARVVWGLSLQSAYDIKSDDSRLAHPLPDTLKEKVEGGKVIAGVSCYAFKP